MSDWQPIETAYTDPYRCESILLAFKDNEDGQVYRKISYWSDAEKGWDGLATSIREGKVTVTHWMPLPKLPTS